MKTEKLRPCSCGSKNLVFVRNTHGPKGPEGELGVRCKECLTTHIEYGRYTKDEAIELWNQRVPQAPKTISIGSVSGIKELLDSIFSSPEFIVLAPMFFLGIVIYEALGTISPAMKH
jgi:hypothetical protein